MGRDLSGAIFDRNKGKNSGLKFYFNPKNLQKSK